MTKQEFIDAVWARLRRVNAVLTWTEEITRTIEQCYEDGFTETDAVRYVRCTEEVSPHLDEDVALARMRALNDKYPKAVARRKQA